MNSTSLLFRLFIDQVSCKLFGTDNIDIVINELDALVNIDFKTRKINLTKKSLSNFLLLVSG